MALPKIGDIVKHPDGRMVKIVDGQYWGEHGLSNHWYWRPVDKNGKFCGPEECGYGWTPKQKKYKMVAHHRPFFAPPRCWVRRSGEVLSDLSWCVVVGWFSMASLACGDRCHNLQTTSQGLRHRPTVGSPSNIHSALQEGPHSEHSSRAKDCHACKKRLCPKMRGEEK